MNIIFRQTIESEMEVFLIASTVHCVQISQSDSKQSGPQRALRFWLVYNKELNSR